MSRHTFFAPHLLIRDMKVDMASRQYGVRHQSRWIREAIQSMASHDERFSTVGVGDGLVNHDERVPLTLDESTIELVAKAVITVRRENPSMEGVRASIYRAAIRFRLHNKAFFP